MADLLEPCDLPALPLEATLQDVIAAAEREELGLAKGTNDHVLSALRTCVRRMYGGEDPSRIRASLDEIDRIWGRGRVGRVPAGYADLGVKGFMQARRYVRSGVGRYTGEAKRRAMLRALNDDWRALRDCIGDGIDGGSLDMRSKQLQALDVLALIARAANRQPAEVDVAWFERALKDVPTARRRRTLREAAQLLDKLHERPDLIDPALLPPNRLSAAKYEQPRRNPRPRPESLMTPLHAFIAKKRRGGEKKGTKQRSGSGITPNTAAMLERGGKWYVDALIVLKLIDPNTSPTPQEIAREDWIDECVRAELDCELPWNRLAANSIYNYYKAAIQWLEPYSPELHNLAGKIKSKHKFLQDVGEMTDANRKWCKAFVRSPKMQLIFFDLPVTLQASAEKALEKYDDLSPGRRAQAIKLAVAAAMAAILVNLPMRSSSMSALTIGGPLANVQRPKSNKDLIRIFLEKEFVKNNTEIDQTIKRKGPVNPREVIDWFMGRPRELLMEKHMKRSPEPQLLFCGIGYERLDEAWQFGTTSVGMPMTQHMARHAIASFLINRDEAYLPLVASLLGITTERARKTYAFLDNQRRAQQADDVLRREIELLRSGDDDDKPYDRGDRS